MILASADYPPAGIQLGAQTQWTPTTEDNFTGSKTVLDQMYYFISFYRQDMSQTQVKFALMLVHKDRYDNKGLVSDNN